MRRHLFNLCLGAAIGGTIFLSAVPASAKLSAPDGGAKSGPGLAPESAGPFSWYLKPSDELGFMNCPQGFQVTADGALNNKFGEFDLFTGNSLTPVNCRIKTLYQNSLPIVQFGFDQDGVHWQLTMFAAPEGLNPMNDLTAFVKVEAKNLGSQPIDTKLKAAYVPRRNDDSRCDLPLRAWYVNQFLKRGMYDASVHEIIDGAALQGHHLVYLYSGRPTVDAGDLSAAYEIRLAPGQTKSISFKVPFAPIYRGLGKAISGVKSMNEADYFRRTVSFWNGLFARATDLSVADPKVVDTLKSSLVYDLMARDINADGKTFSQTVNKFQYHYFFARDTAFITRTYEMLGLPEVARQNIEDYLVRGKDGKVASFVHIYPDDWGQSMWAIGEYVRSTGDVSLAKEVSPALAHHLDLFEKSVASDPQGLWPVAGPYDNELIDGHYTSHNLWALLGLRSVGWIYDAVGDSAGASRASNLYDAFGKVFQAKLKSITDKDGGYIPPGLDDPTKGFDWENASGGVYPFGVLKADDPRVTTTLNMERQYKYREGIMTWGPNAYVGMLAAKDGKPYDPLYLHDYDTFQVDETLLARGDQQAVVQDLYSTLVHTSSTNAGFETGIRPWGDRDPGTNYPPHGWFAARYAELVRNMLVREDGDGLALCSALAPDWVEAGKTVSVKRGATRFGEVNFSLNCRADGATLDFSGGWRIKPSRISVHIPWFLTVTKAEADGQAVTVSDGAIVLPPGFHHLNLRWTWNSHPELSYEKAVQVWLQKNYQPRPGDDRNHLFPFSPLPASE